MPLAAAEVLGSRLLSNSKYMESCGLGPTAVHTSTSQVLHLREDSGSKSVAGGWWEPLKSDCLAQRREGTAGSLAICINI